MDFFYCKISICSTVLIKLYFKPTSISSKRRIGIFLSSFRQTLATEVSRRGA